MNMLATIVPKSDQLNADDLIGRDLTITITSVGIRPGTEQPVTINFDGDGGKPWKPCKSMCRVLVSAWGPDAKLYEGRGLTLYRDADVKWGGMKVGGIRISHMSHLKGDLVMALTETKGSKKAFKVVPLTASEPQKPKGRTAAEFLADLEADLRDCGDKEAVRERMARDDVTRGLEHLKNASLVKLQALMLEHRERVGLTLDDPDSPAEMQT